MTRIAFCAACCSLAPLGEAIAETSTINSTVRVFEDAVWLIAFCMLLAAAIRMSPQQSAWLTLGRWLLAGAGLLGWLWKGIGLANRTHLLTQPEWLILYARETFEGLTAILMALALSAFAMGIKNFRQ